MNTGNALYEFTGELIARSGGALADTSRHLDVYESFTGKSGKWIRFSGMRGGSPVLINDRIRVDNAAHLIYFVVRPENQGPAARVAAREVSELMAEEWAIAVFEDNSLGGRVCGIGNLKQLDDWMMPATALKMPVTVIQITINPI